jgi:hypothetical protein
MLLSTLPGARQRPTARYYLRQNVSGAVFANLVLSCLTALERLPQSTEGGLWPSLLGFVTLLSRQELGWDLSVPWSSVLTNPLSAE